MNLSRLLLFGFGLLAGCAHAPGEIAYATATIIKYRQCDELPAASYQQCVDKLKEREAEGRRVAEEHARRQRGAVTEKELSPIEQAMRDNENRR